MNNQSFVDDEILYTENFDLESIVTPIRPDILEQFLQESNYDRQKTTYLVNGFREGFSISYRGNTNRTDTAANHRLHCGNKIILWNKLMKEVQNKRVSGPWKDIPYQNSYVQSPITLVPKGKEGTQTRLVFNLSYQFPEGSVNAATPRELCTVKYEDIDSALKLILEEDDQTGPVFFGKLDASSAFRRIPLVKDDSRWLIMKAENPLDGRTYYFADRCLCFGHAISCRIYQDFLMAVGYSHAYRTGKKPNCYLDDVLVVGMKRQFCLFLMTEYQNLCDAIGLPLSPEKIEGPCSVIEFLGMLLNGIDRTLGLPEDKICKAMDQLDYTLEHKSATVHHLQKLTGLLNFFCRAIVPGRAFTRRMYAKFSSINLKRFHHVRVDREIRKDCMVWKTFLHHKKGKYNRPFADFALTVMATELQYFTDSSFVGAGGFFDGRYFYCEFEPGFVVRTKAHIALLELYAITVSIHLWAKYLKGMKVLIFSDSMSAVEMVNSASSSCARCMHLIRHITLVSLKYRTRISVRHILGRKNILADKLSRLQIKAFKALVPKGKLIEPEEKLPEELWPIPNNWWVDDL